MNYVQTNNNWSTPYRKVVTPQGFGEINDDIVRSLESIVGNENMSTAMAVREQHGKDESYHKCHPSDLVVWANNKEQVSQVARLCNDHVIPLIPFGSGTGLEGGVVAVKVQYSSSELSNLYSCEATLTFQFPSSQCKFSQIET